MKSGKMTSAGGVSIARTHLTAKNRIIRFTAPGPKRRGQLKGIRRQGSGSRASRHPGHSPPLRLEQAEGLELLQTGADAGTLYTGGREAAGVGTGKNNSVEKIIYRTS